LEKYNGNMLEIVKQKRSDIPAVTHVDYSARIQTVSEETNPYYYNVIKEFKKLTGYGVIVNTSFNVRGEPIVCTPEHAYACFMRTDMDVLVLENCILYKEEQPPYKDHANWRELYQLD
ncbi:carbamoyltransferase C-terminal domain-containing protein, partial [Bacteroides congonensis]|uniref:carbamoyltransferase C-terminal domain-containing protein n=1 Tax=Bacteroides congonensis TaxID=1871006 RepID=UPI00321AC826